MVCSFDYIVHCKSMKNEKVQYIECIQRGKSIDLDYEELEKCLTVNKI